ncbi:hypothetical protein NUM_23120 [Actinocatenispora comari]|uniref:Uncharacterized protein n=1 Tax=Actinocatenispora comari TaxID=2807577 RepID=A0A8J4AA09_9ACTN|nr:hypothetical protein NUM_23120 [Actinocatenispora comari]
MHIYDVVMTRGRAGRVLLRRVCCALVALRARLSDGTGSESVNGAGAGAGPARLSGRVPPCPPAPAPSTQAPEDESIAEGVAAAFLVLARHVPYCSALGVRCRICVWPYPCAAVRLANDVLVRTGHLDRAVTLPPIDPYC